MVLSQWFGFEQLLTKHMDIFRMPQADATHLLEFPINFFLL